MILKTMEHYDLTCHESGFTHICWRICGHLALRQMSAQPADKNKKAPKQTWWSCDQWSVQSSVHQRVDSTHWLWLLHFTDWFLQIWLIDGTDHFLRGTERETDKDSISISAYYYLSDRQRQVFVSLMSHSGTCHSVCARSPVRTAMQRHDTSLWGHFRRSHPFP